jgi:hypothetical protein
VHLVGGLEDGDGAVVAGGCGSGGDGNVGSVMGSCGSGMVARPHQWHLLFDVVAAEVDAGK